MSAFSPSASFQPPRHMGRTLKAFTVEASALFKALSSPGKFVAKVERVGALQAEANRTEASDPKRAADLRRHATRILR